MLVGVGALVVLALIPAGVLIYRKARSPVRRRWGSCALGSQDVTVCRASRLLVLLGGEGTPWWRPRPGPLPSAAGAGGAVGTGW